MKGIRLAALGVAVMAMASVAGAQAPAASDSGKAHGHGQHGQQGQQGQHGEMRGERGPRGRGPMRGLFRGITLSDAQKAQARAISEKYRDQMRTQREGWERSARPDSARMQQMRSLMERQRSELRGVLTADQQKVFDQNLATMKERMQKRQERRADRHESRSGQR